MATFTESESNNIIKEAVKQLKANGVSDIPWTKPEAKAAAQNIRDILDGASHRSSVSTAIDNGLTIGRTMTVGEKTRFNAIVMNELYNIEK